MAFMCIKYKNVECDGCMDCVYEEEQELEEIEDECESN